MWLTEKAFLLGEANCPMDRLLSKRNSTKIYQQALSPQKLLKAIK
jgi:hypothetical protein